MVLTVAGGKATVAKTPTIDGSRSRVGRIRKGGAGWWLFETCPEYPLQNEEWEPYCTARRKQDVLAQAIRCHLNGWITEWFEE